MEFNYSQRQLIYENLKDVLQQKFEGFGNKTMRDVYGPTTQALIREAILTYCLYSEIKVKEIKEKYKDDDDKPQERIVSYSFSVPIKLPIISTGFDIVRDIPAQKLDEIA